MLNRFLVTASIFGMGLTIGIVAGILGADVKCPDPIVKKEWLLPDPIERESYHDRRKKCERLEIDPRERFDPELDDGTEYRWLNEACYQQRRFNYEYMHCVYSRDPDGPIWLPERRLEEYPCRFSRLYEKAHGLEIDRWARKDDGDG